MALVRLRSSPKEARRWSDHEKILYFSVWFFASIAIAVFASEPSLAADGSLFDLPILKLENLPAGGQSLSLSLQTLILMSALTILPSMLLVTTSFTRIIITLSILRQAMGTQQTPPNQVLVGLALFMTLFVMTPTIREVNDAAFAPYSAGQISIEQAGIRTGGIMKQFMMRQTRQADILMVAELRGDKAMKAPPTFPFL